MLTQEIRDIIKEEAKQFCRTEGKPDVILTCTDYSLAGLVAYNEGATKYAELMIEFAEWCTEHYYSIEPGGIWVHRSSEDARRRSTSDLLTIFLKEKNKQL